LVVCGTGCCCLFLFLTETVLLNYSCVVVTRLLERERGGG
jgi:hypothetical protein